MPHTLLSVVQLAGQSQPPVFLPACCFPLFFNSSSHPLSVDERTTPTPRPYILPHTRHCTSAQHKHLPIMYPTYARASPSKTHGKTNKHWHPGVRGRSLSARQLVVITKANLISWSKRAEPKRLKNVGSSNRAGGGRGLREKIAANSLQAENSQQVYHFVSEGSLYQSGHPSRSLLHLFICYIFLFEWSCNAECLLQKKTLPLLTPLVSVISLSTKAPGLFFHASSSFLFIFEFECPIS